MHCSVCGEFHTIIFAGDNGRLLCELCRNGKRCCKECCRYFSDPKKQGVFTTTLDNNGWYCWDCILQKTIPEIEEDQNWVGYTAGRRSFEHFYEKAQDRVNIKDKTLRSIKTLKKEEAWQICTVIFEEIPVDYATLTMRR